MGVGLSQRRQKGDALSLSEYCCTFTKYFTLLKKPSQWIRLKENRGNFLWIDRQTDSYLLLVKMYGAWE